MPPRADRRRKQYADFEIQARTEDMPNDTIAQRRQIGQAKRRITQESMTQWRLLTEHQRQRIIGHMIAVKVARRNIAAQEAHVRREDLELSRFLITQAPRAVDWKRIIPRCSNMVHLYRDLSGLQTHLVNACIAFANSATVVYNNDIVGIYALDLLIQEQDTFLYYEEREEVFRHHSYNPALPRRGDGRLKIQEDWLPAWKQMQEGIPEADRRRADFPGSAHESPLGPGWVGGWEAAQGGMSTTNLWIQFNPDNIIINRMFQKDVYRTRHDWAMGTQWDGDIHDPDRRPMEIACHDLYDIPESNLLAHINVAELWRSYVNNKLFKYSMYLRYHGFGDLSQLIQRHSREGRDRRIPEPFLWRTFESLSKVGLAMERGYVDANLGVPDNWREIVHRDLKPGNVFLGESTNNHFEMYPTPILGDFGLAIKTTTDDPLNPGIFVNGGGTLGFEAPEQISYIDYRSLEPVDDFKFCSKTNVWGVGMILYSLAMRSHGLQNLPRWLGEGYDDPNHPQIFTRPINYSDDLRDLIDRCLNFDPEQRPAFADILNEIDTAINNDLTNGKKDARRHEIPADDEDRLEDKVDDYALSLRRQDLPVR